MNDLERPIWQLTVREFINILDNARDVDNTKEVEPIKVTNTEYGIAGLAKLLGCSISHANRLKKAGLYDEAIMQTGRKIIIDRDKVFEILKREKDGI